MKDLEQLSYSLKNGKPILLLGAGFSVGAKNEHGDLVCGKSLAEKIYNEFYSKRRGEITEEQAQYAEGVKNDLKGLCSLIRSEGEKRLRERNDFLTTLFSDCEPADFHKLITKFNWDEIFTLNIDDVVEHIYDETELAVWTHEKHGYDAPAKTKLIKLHGCVNSSSEGYIFDNDEYRGFLDAKNCLLREFADAKVKHDLICIGTEFQEEDLLSILDNYKASGYDYEKHVFFVTNKIHSGTLMNQIRSNDKYHHIEMTTEAFLNYLNKYVGPMNNSDLALKEDGARFISDFANVKKSYYSDIYKGYESKYEDFWADFNIIHPQLQTCYQNIVDSSKSMIYFIYGKAYVGKTCFARGLLVKLARNDYQAIEYIINDVHCIQMLLDYFRSLPKDSKVAILCESAAFKYDLISSLLSQIPQNIKQCVVLAVDNIQNHNQKVHHILNRLKSNKIKHCDFAVSEHIDVLYARNIIDKLEEKNWIVEIKKYADTLASQYKFAKEINDIVELLYINSNGQRFEEHLSIVFGDSLNSTSYKYLTVLSLLSSMGITNVPIRVFKALFDYDQDNIKYRAFLRDYSDWIENDSRHIHLRCQRLIKTTLADKISDDEVIEVISKIVHQTIGQFDESTHNEWSELFQKVLHTDTMLYEINISLNSARTLFLSIEQECKDLSYYWIERGLVEAKFNDFEEANRCFMNALGIRPSSYQSAHAIAKNNMERGIYSYKMKKSSHAIYYYEEGLKGMKNLVESQKYSDSYNYSVHALIDMQLKYSEAFSEELSYDECWYMANLFKKAEPDNYLNNIAQKLYDYCADKKYTDIKLIVKEFIDINKSVRSRNL